MLSNCGAGADSWESLDNKEINPVNPKGNQPWIFIGRTNAEAETPMLNETPIFSNEFGKYPDAGKDWRQKEKGWKRIRWLDSITDLIGMNLSKLQEIVEERTPWCPLVHGIAKSWTWLNDWTTKTYRSR